MGKFSDLLNRKLKIVEKPDYVRPEYNSYMSGPEWRNVEIAQEFAKFLKEGKSLFLYPYFQQIFDIWKVFYNSYIAAKKYDKHRDILTSEYMVMDVFVSFFTTMELLPKGLLSLLLRPFINPENKTQMQAKLGEYFQKYADDLQTIPFYDQQYAESKKALSAAYQQASDKTWGDWLSFKLVSADLTARYWVSKPLHKWFHSESNIVTPTTDVLVKLKVDSQNNSDSPEGIFRQKISGMKDRVSIVREHVYVKESKKESKTYSSVYALLRTNRYAEFQEDIKKLNTENIKLRKIASQDQVQVKCEIDAANVILNNIPHAKFLYAYGDRIHPNRQICLFDVPVKQLQETVDDLNSRDNIKVKYIHNF